MPKNLIVITKLFPYNFTEAFLESDSFSTRKIQENHLYALIKRKNKTQFLKSNC